MRAGERILGWLWPLAFAIVAGYFMFRLGMRCIPGLSAVYAWTALGCLVLVYIVSAVAVFRAKRKTESIRLKEYRERMLEQKARTDRGENGLYARLVGSVAFLYIRIAACVILSLLTIFFAGANEQDWVVCAPCTVIPVFTLWGILSTLLSFTLKEPDEPIRDILPRERFPKMYETLDEVFPDEKQPPLMNLYALDNIGVGRTHGRIVVGVGALIGAFLCREEFKQVLLHEKAHILYDDKPTVRVLNKIFRQFREPSFKCILLKPVDVLFLAPLAYAAQCLSEYRYISSERQEKQADLYSVQNGKNAESAAALVKTNLVAHYLRYEYEAVPYYEPEEIPKTYVKNMFRSFRTVCVERLDFWIDLFRKELPGQIDTHPTLTQRLHALNDPSYTIVFDDPDPDYAKEQEEILRFNDEAEMNENEESYAETRRERYLEPKERVEKYLSGIENGQTYTALELRPIIDDCLTLKNESLAKEICDRAIAASENDHEAAYAYYIKGLYLLHRYDPEGVAYVRKAAETNQNYLESASEEIGQFYRMMGMEEELRDYRRYILELAQKKIDDRVDDADSLNPSDRLTAVPTLPESELLEEQAFILDACGENIQALYRVSKKLSASLSSTVYIVRFRTETDPKTCNACMERIFQYLDGLDGQYSLFDYEYAEEQKVRLDRIKGALIWQIP